MKKISPEYRTYLKAQVARGGEVSASASFILAKYEAEEEEEEDTLVKFDESQERDEHGRFAGGGGGESNSKGTVQNAIDKYSDKQDKADSTYSDARGYDTKHSYGKATDAHKEAAKAATEVANHPGASLGTKEYFARQAALHTAFAKAYAAAAKSTKE